MTVRLMILLLTFLSGCAQLRPDVELVTSGSNYVTFEHPFTDAAAEEVRSKSLKHCAQQKKSAIKTQSACSLTKCTTTYQCTE